MVNRHEEDLNRLAGRIEQEARERQAGDSDEQRHREELGRSLDQRIREAAAGGLRLETAGVLLFAVGLGLGTWGNLIA